MVHQETAIQPFHAMNKHPIIQHSSLFQCGCYSCDTFLPTARKPDQGSLLVSCPPMVWGEICLKIHGGGGGVHLKLHTYMILRYELPTWTCTRTWCYVVSGGGAGSKRVRLKLHMYLILRYPLCTLRLNLHTYLMFHSTWGGVGSKKVQETEDTTWILNYSQVTSSAVEVLTHTGSCDSCWKSYTRMIRMISSTITSRNRRLDDMLPSMAVAVRPSVCQYVHDHEKRINARVSLW